jgi:hypothetical protein
MLRSSDNLSPAEETAIRKGILTVCRSWGEILPGFEDVIQRASGTELVLCAAYVMLMIGQGQPQRRYH